LLASKSNYQNILDGTTVPGVVYPTSLSTNLTSKRTSHKIAEQGRRNRINTALQEMQQLLPLAQQVKEGKSPENSIQASNSKAAKVESAIGYIRELQQEVSNKDKLLAERDQEMEALRKELAALRQGSSAAPACNSETAATTTQDNAPSRENAT
jgi:vacuolar-type H+-ATPase subunit I/STV1